jgi:S-formylglutathione hydrolase FrmB
MRAISSSLLVMALSAFASHSISVAAEDRVAPAPALSASKVEYVDVESPSLGRDIAVGVYLPAGYSEQEDRRYPVLYFLHGLFGSERKWQQRGTPEHVDRLIRDKSVEPMIVVCPNGENSFYMNWEAFIIKDLVAAIDAKYRTIPKREQRGISGDSMGGFGALNLGFRNPQIFGSISAHSAALLPEDPSETPEWMQRFGKRVRQIFGDPPDAEVWKANNPIHLARAVDVKVLNSIAIYFDCGESDRYGFDVGAQALHDALEKREVRHEFHLRKGGHGADYFIEYVDHSLVFHGNAFHAAPSQDGAVRPKEDSKDH